MIAINMVYRSWQNDVTKRTYCNVICIIALQPLQLLFVTVNGRHGRPFHSRTETPWDPLQKTLQRTTTLQIAVCRTKAVSTPESDESNVSNAGGRCRVYCRLYARYVDTCVLEHDGFGGGGVMVWGVITDNFNSCWTEPSLPRGMLTKCLVCCSTINAGSHI